MPSYTAVRDLGKLSNGSYAIAVPKKEAISIVQEFGKSSFDPRDFSEDNNRVRGVEIKSDSIKFADGKIGGHESVLLMSEERHAQFMAFVTDKLNPQPQSGPQHR